MNKDNIFTDGNFLIAQSVCLNKDKSSHALNVFNKLFRALSNYISNKYKVVNDIQQNEIKNRNEEKFNIFLPNRMLNNSNEISDEETVRYSDFVQVSIGEFIFTSFRTWNPEKSKYLTYVDRLLKRYQLRFPKGMSQDQVKIENLLRKSIIPILKGKTGLRDIPRDMISVYIEQYLPDLPQEKKDAIQRITESPLELDRQVNNDTSDSNDETTYLDQLSKTYDSGDLPQAFEDIVNILYVAFSKEQDRTKDILSLYLTVIVYMASSFTKNIRNFEILANKYPQMLDITKCKWIDSIYEKRKEKYIEELSNPDFNRSQLFPSNADQAQYIGKKEKAYEMVISRFKKKVRPLIPKKYLRFFNDFC